MVSVERAMEMAARSAHKVCRAWRLPDAEDFAQEMRLAVWEAYPQIDQARPDAAIACYVSKLVRWRIGSIVTSERDRRGRDVRLGHYLTEAQPDRPDQLVEVADEAEVIFASVRAALDAVQWERVGHIVGSQGPQSATERKAIERFRKQIMSALVDQIEVDTAAADRLLRISVDPGEAEL